MPPIFPPGKFNQREQARIDAHCTSAVHSYTFHDSASCCSQVYTPVTNLRKMADMDVGQVGYHNMSLVRTRAVYACRHMTLARRFEGRCAKTTET